MKTVLYGTRQIFCYIVVELWGTYRKRFKWREDCLFILHKGGGIRSPLLCCIMILSVSHFRTGKVSTLLAFMVGTLTARGLWCGSSPQTNFRRLVILQLIIVYNNHDCISQCNLHEEHTFIVYRGPTAKSPSTLLRPCLY